MDILKKIQDRAVSRRNFLAGAGATGAAVALAGCGSNALPSANPTTNAAYTDADYLNFALNLEYLEASFYLYAATGSGLPAASTGTGAGTVTGGSMVSGMTATQQQIINEIAFDELSHVNFLRSALGSAAVAMPNLNIGSAFQTLATAAGVSGGSSFSPYSSFTNFLIGAFVFEDVGVTAYSGAAPLLTSSANLNYAAGIQAVEAYHAAYVRTSITALAASNSASYGALITIANQVSTLRGTLGGGNETPLTQLSSTVGGQASTIVAATSANAIAYARTTDQVLHIVYGAAGGAGVSSGVFFPNGLNGNIKVTQS